MRNLKLNFTKKKSIEFQKKKFKNKAHKIYFLVLKLYVFVCQL